MLAMRQLTEVDVDADKDGDGDENHDISDLAELFADNKHSPEYYIQQLENFDEAVYTKENHCPNSKKLLDQFEQQWFW
jgi:hypothetical protein